MSADQPDERRGLLPRFTLKHSDTFLLANALGDIQGSDDGLFTNDTRMLSRFELLVAGNHPSLLGAAVSEDNTLFTAHLTNRPLPALGEGSFPQGVIHIERNRLLHENRVYERLRFTNFSNQEARLPLRFCFAADFADIFEVQGHARPRHGEHLRTTTSSNAVQLRYRGLDERERTTSLTFSVAPRQLVADEATLEVNLKHGAVAELFVEIGPESSCAPSAARFDAALRAAADSVHDRLRDSALVDTTGPLFNQWIGKSRYDLSLLTTDLPTGPYPYAGIPWFATQFGRDAIITSLQTLWIRPLLAAGVLRFLASTQAQEESAFRDSQPGKILHEMRRGEMAALQEVPFGRYYGGVDTTPLFVMLAGAYERHTGDRALADEIWNSLLRATAWIEQRLDRSATGFLDYARGERTGLVNQAWKDSQDSIFHEDGRFPTGPVAVVEVQGYAFAALNTMSDLAAARGRSEQAAAWRMRAESLRAAIEQRFWLPELNFYALAIDGEGEPCRVVASNAGHLLYCGVPNEERALLVADQLLGERFCSGWGIRTLAEGAARYNPMSYHNGSVWPHDTSLCAAGISRYGRRDRIAQITSDMFEAANYFDRRLPELFCGFARVSGQGPAPYPVACLPQAWACGSIFMLLQACLGISIDGRRREVHISQPHLPAGVDTLTISDLAVANARIDLEFHRLGDQVAAVPTRHSHSGVRVLTHL